VRYSATARCQGEQKHLRSGAFLCVSNVIDRWLPMLTSKEQLADFCSDSLFLILANWRKISALWWGSRIFRSTLSNV
jgi:hypothetical protein